MHQGRTPAHVTGQAAAAMADPDKDAKRKSDGRFAKLNQFNDRGIREAKLSMSAQIVWDCLWRHEFEGVAIISIDGIMKQRNISERSVYNALSELKDAHMLETIERGNSCSNCSKYRLFPLPTGVTIAPVEESATGATIAATGATIAATGATIAATGAKNDTPTEGQKVSGPSVLPIQKRRADPADARLGDARPAVPTQKTNSDGGTNPLSPPSMSTLGGEPPEVDDEPTYRERVNNQIDHRLADGQSLTKIKDVLTSLAGKNQLHLRIIAEEIAKRCASA